MVTRMTRDNGWRGWVAGVGIRWAIVVAAAAWIWATPVGARADDVPAPGQEQPAVETPAAEQLQLQGQATPASLPTPVTPELTGTQILDELWKTTVPHLSQCQLGIKVLVDDKSVGQAVVGWSGGLTGTVALWVSAFPVPVRLALRPSGFAMVQVGDQQTVTADLLPLRSALLAGERLVGPLVQAVWQAQDATVIGTEKVAGRQAYVVDVTENADRLRESLTELLKQVLGDRALFSEIMSELPALPVPEELWAKLSEEQDQQIQRLVGPGGSMAATPGTTRMWVDATDFVVLQQELRDLPAVMAAIRESGQDQAGPVLSEAEQRFEEAVLTAIEHLLQSIHSDPPEVDVAADGHIERVVNRVQTQLGAADLRALLQALWDDGTDPEFSEKHLAGLVDAIVPPDSPPVTVRLETEQSRIGSAYLPTRLAGTLQAPKGLKGLAQDLALLGLYLEKHEPDVEMGEPAAAADESWALPTDEGSDNALAGPDAGEEGILTDENDGAPGIPADLLAAAEQAFATAKAQGSSELETHRAVVELDWDLSKGVDQALYNAPQLLTVEEGWKAGIAAFMRHDSKGTVQALRPVVRYVPSFALAHDILADAYMDLGDTWSAISEMEQVIMLQPRKAVTKNNLAYLYVDNDIDAARGLELALEAANSDPTNPMYLDTAGWAYFKNGQPEQAADALEAALEQLGTEEWKEEDTDENRAELEYHLAAVYARLGEWELAERHVEQALQRQPQHQAALELKAEILAQRSTASVVDL